MRSSHFLGNSEEPSGTEHRAVVYVWNAEQLSCLSATHRAWVTQLPPFAHILMEKFVSFRTLYLPLIYISVFKLINLNY